MPSPSTSAAFEEASLVMTLAKKFDLTRFKPYQRQVIQGIQEKRNCLVIQPTGSGKSLCFQLPAVCQNKLAVVVVPTISLMQDHVKNCEKYGIKAELLGSAQLDLSAEDRVFSTENDVSIVFVTPEWIANPQKRDKVKRMAELDQVSLICLDEAHLFHYWEEFHPAYREPESLHLHFSSIPLVCLTATAPDSVERSMRRLV